jgi:hypothetical protein
MVYDTGQTLNSSNQFTVSAVFLIPVSLVFKVPSQKYCVLLGLVSFFKLHIQSTLVASDLKPHNKTSQAQLFTTNLDLSLLA